MYAFIKGKIVETGIDSLVLENNGIGYIINVPAGLTQREAQIGDEVKMYTHYSVREDGVALYGFLSRDDLDIFKMLITVSGIGPKGALGILSGLTADELRFAIMADDAKTISKAPGIGAKTARKIILELKDKLDLGEVLEGSGRRTETGLPQTDESPQSEAVQALVALGVTSAEALKAVRKAVETAGTEDVEAIIKEAFRILY